MKPLTGRRLVQISCCPLAPQLHHSRTPGKQQPCLGECCSCTSQTVDNKLSSFFKDFKPIMMLGSWNSIEGTTWSDFFGINLCLVVDSELSTAECVLCSHLQHSSSACSQCVSCAATKVHRDWCSEVQMSPDRKSLIRTGSLVCLGVFRGLTLGDNSNP